MKDRIRELIEENLPLVNPDASCLWEELDSLGLVQLQLLLSQEFHIELSSRDATPRNLRTLDSLVALVEQKQKEKLSE